MTKKTLYECSHCHSYFENEEDCKECEQNHIQVTKIAKVFYDEDDSKNYPTAIDMEFEDGKTLSFMPASLLGKVRYFGSPYTNPNFTSMTDSEITSNQAALETLIKSYGTCEDSYVDGLKHVWSDLNMEKLHRAIQST